MRKKIFTWVIVFFVGGGLMMWKGFGWFEQSNLYFPIKEIPWSPAGAGLPFESVVVETEDGERLAGWFIPAPAEEKEPFTLLFFNGNAGNIGYRVDKAARLHSRGFNVFLFDYRGYGPSTGRPSEEGLYRDGEAVYRFLTEKRGIAPMELIFYGESLGAAVAVQTALGHSCAGLILESGFTSTVDMAKRLFPILPLHRVVTQKYDTHSKIGRLKAPLLILHSRNDEIIPFRMAEQLQSAATSPVVLVPLEGGHNDATQQSADLYLWALDAFKSQLRPAS